MSQNKTICETKPIFLLGKRNENGGLTLGVPLVYNGLMADHVLHSSDGSSHPSQLVVSDFKTQSGSLITGENAPFISEIPNINIRTGARGDRAGMQFKLNQEKVKILKSKYPTIRNSNRLDKFFIQSFSKSGTAPTVAQYAKIMKEIQNTQSAKNLQGSPLEYKRILDYFQFTLVQTLNNSDGKLFLYRPSVHRIQENLSQFSNYKEAIMNSYISQDEDDFLLYDRAFFATKDRPAALASVIRGIKTVFKRSSSVEGVWRSYAFTGNTRDNITKLREYIKSDLAKSLGGEEKIKEYITYDYKTTKGDITYFLNYKKFLTLKNSVLKAKVLFWWIFNYPGDNDGKLLHKFIAILDTFHDFTGIRATGKKPTEGGFNGIWPSGTNMQKNSKGINFAKVTANNVLTTKSGYLVKILGRNIYRLAKDDGAAQLVANKNKRNLGVSNTNTNAKRKLSHLLYFFANILGGAKDLTSKCEEYASEILVKTGQIIEKKDFCKLLDNGGKHGLVIDFFSGGGLSCIKDRSSIHAVGILDPAPRSAKGWKELMLSEGRHQCVGKGTKIPVQIDFDVDDENRLIRAHQEYQRQLSDIYNMKGNVTIANASNIVGNKRTRVNNITNNKTNVKRGPFVKAVRPTTNSSKLINISMGAPQPKMEAFKLFISSNTVTNEATKNLLNKVTRNQNRFNGKNKQLVRNILNKILRRTNQPRELSNIAINLKAKMFSTNVRQLRARRPPPRAT
tara:strand:+ start:588 stop:2789 length:2202 start_codon:yes stop_codon:yes gene_type:complete